MRVQDGQIAVNPPRVAGLGKAAPLGCGLNQGLLRLQLVPQCFPLGQGVGRFPEGCLDRLLVLGQGDPAVDLRRGQVGQVRAGIEDRQDDPGRKAPGAGSGLEEPGQFVA